VKLGAPDGWETVHTVGDYWDGPRSGIADYHGIPHTYLCEWSEEEDDWSDVFRLLPISRETFRLEMEAWALSRKWRDAFEAGTLGPGDSFPVLLADRARYDAVRLELDEAPRVDDSDAIRATAQFRGTWNPVHDLRVRWSPLEGDAA
jgi:hypothetical protein